MTLIVDDSTESWEDWEFQVGTIPAPRDPRKSNHWYIRDATRLYLEFIQLCSADDHFYNFHLEGEYILDNGRTRRFFVRKRRDGYVDWYMNEQALSGLTHPMTRVESLYDDVINWGADIEDLLEEMDDLITVTHSGDVLDVDRYGDREGGVRKLFEMWEDVRSIVNEYKTRKWHSAFQLT